MKRIIIFGVCVALTVFFCVPSMLFSDTDDEYTYSGIDNGQYTMDLTGEVPENNDPDMDVYCIDDDTTLNYGNDEYVEIDVQVSDELQDTGGNFDEPPLDEISAEAVEIIATTATGGRDQENQDAVHDIIEKDTPTDSEVEKIVDAVMTIAEGFVDSGDNVNGDDGSSLQAYLDEQDINEIEVILDDNSLLDESTGEYNEFEATVIMENPLVPGVTDGETAERVADGEEVVLPDPDGAKTVFWYILEDSFNVSFSQDDLVTETTSLMFDYEDDWDGNSSTTDSDFDSILDGDMDEDGDVIGDNYGMSTIPYYFYWWGEGFPEYMQK